MQYIENLKNDFKNKICICIGFALTPFHLLQILAFYEQYERVYILTPHASEYSKLLKETFPKATFIDINERRKIVTTIAASKNMLDSLTFIYAVCWNKTALLIEKYVLMKKGEVIIIDDGIGNFIIRKSRRYSLYDIFHKFVFKLLFNVQYVNNCYGKKLKDNTKIKFFSVVSEKSTLKRLEFPVAQIDFSMLREKLPSLSNHYAHLKCYKNYSVFFDTTDAEHNWINIEDKVNVLREVLPRDEKILYFPHPFQVYNLANYFDNFIDLTGKTCRFNELSAYFIEPQKVYSVFSTAFLTLRYIFNLNFENILLHEIFYKKVGDPRYLIEKGVLEKL